LDGDEQADAAAAVYEVQSAQHEANECRQCNDQELHDGQRILLVLHLESGLLEVGYVGVLTLDLLVLGVKLLDRFLVGEGIAGPLVLLIVLSHELASGFHAFHREDPCEHGVDR